MEIRLLAKAKEVFSKTLSKICTTLAAIKRSVFNLRKQFNLIVLDLP
jgi:hypothetical protein